MDSTLVLGDSFAPPPRRPGDGALARVFGASLDASLAAGRPPESSRLLAARARDIVRLRRRRSMAGSWEHLLRVASRAQRARGAGPGGPGAPGAPGRLGGPTGAVPVCADRVVAAEPAIRDLMNRLTAPLPVPARGVAMARVLLTDGTSPVYNRHARVALSDAVTAAAAQLDPALPLLPLPPGQPPPEAPFPRPSVTESDISPFLTVPPPPVMIVMARRSGYYRPNGPRGQGGSAFGEGARRIRRSACGAWSLLVLL